MSMTAFREIEQGCYALAMRRAARRLTALYDTALRSVGLRATQLSLLVAIGQDEGITIQVLAQSLAIDRTTLSRNLRPLERDGLIEIRQGTDLRQRRLHITEQGVARVKAAHSLWREAQRTVERELGGLVVVKLRGDLGRLSRQL